MINKENIFKQTLKYKLLNDKNFFVQFFFKKAKNTKFLLNWHHAEILKEIENIERYKTKIANVNLPPRHSKTALLAVFFISYSFSKNPKAKFLYITADDKLRNQTSLEIKDIMQSEPYKWLFDVRLRKDNNTKGLWTTEQGGSLITATIFGQITGHGAGILRSIEEREDEFDGAIILDDINKIEDAELNNKRNQRANEIIISTILSRRNTEDTPLINIQQRSGVHDATALLQDLYKGKKGYKELVFPIIYKNKPLWKDKMSMTAINELKNHPKTAHIFDTQYMQQPRPRKGILFKNEDFTYFSKFAEKTKYNFAYIDTKGVGKDYFCMLIGVWHNNKIYIVDLIYNKFDSYAQINKILELSKKHNLLNCYIETNFNGGLLVKTLNEKNNIFQGVFERKNKEQRIYYNSEYIKKYLVLKNNGNAEYETFKRHLFQYQKFVKNQYDDGADCSTGLINIFKQNALIT